jgi:hypothetical protein
VLGGGFDAAHAELDGEVVSGVVVACCVGGFDAAHAELDDEWRENMLPLFPGPVCVCVCVRACVWGWRGMGGVFACVCVRVPTLLVYLLVLLHLGIWVQCPFDLRTRTKDESHLRFLPRGVHFRNALQ